MHRANGELVFCKCDIILGADIVAAGRKDNKTHLEHLGGTV